MSIHRRLVGALGLAALLLVGAVVGTGVSAAMSTDDGDQSLRASATVQDPATIVNLIGHDVAVKRCTPDTTFTVPVGKALLITDVVSYAGQGRILLRSDTRGEILRAEREQFVHLISPLVVSAGETVCAAHESGLPSINTLVLISGQLVDVP